MDLENAQLVLSADIFNIFNQQKIREVAENDTPFYGLPTGFQPPRSLRLSARYRFF
jgi:outer membrane receptor protein involved in Fe transport